MAANIVLDEDKKRYLSQRAIYFLNDAIEYRSAKGAKYNDIDQYLDTDINRNTVEDQLAVAHGLNPSLSNIQERNQKNLIRNSLTKRGMISYAAAAKGTDETVIKSIANDRKAGKRLNELVKEINSTDGYDHQRIDEIIEAYKGNITGTFFVSSDSGESRVNFRSVVVTTKNLLLDKMSDPNSMQTSRFVGYDGIEKKLVDLDDSTGPLFAEELETLKEIIYEEIKSRFLEGKNTKSLSDEELAEIVKMQEETMVELAKVHFYSKDDKCTYIATVVKDYETVLNMKRYAAVAVYGKEVRYNAYFQTVYKTNSHYSNSALLENIPFNEKEAEVFEDFLTALEKNAIGTILTPSDSYQSIAEGIRDKQQVIEVERSPYDSKDVAEQLQTPSISSIVNSLPYFTKYFNSLSPESSKELQGTSDTKLKAVQDDNISSRRAIVKILSESSRRAAEDRTFIILKLVKEYGDEYLYVRTESVFGAMVRKVLKSKILGGESLNKVAIEIDSVDRQKKATELLQKREALSILLNMPNVNKDNVTKKIFDLYEDVLGGDDEITTMSKYPAEQVQAALNDLKLVIGGEDVVPSTIVSIGYANTIVNMVSTERDIFTNTDGSLTDEGKRVLEFMKKVKTIYQQNKQKNSFLFQEVELKDKESEARHLEQQRNPEQQGDASKAAFAVQTDYAAGSGAI